MPADIIVGLQWGDEGKGKIVDILAPNYYAIARYQGGHNAGHTVVVGDKKYVFHMVPSGVLHPHVKNVIGNGTVVSVSALKKEIEELQTQGISITPENFYISDRAHLIMPYHIAEEQTAATKSIGTTGRGIGPAYTSKARRTGLRICDLANLDVMGNDYALEQIQKNIGAEESERFLDEQKRDFEFVQRYVDDTSSLLNDWLKKGEKLLCEGAQGTFLDVDHGTYPFVTSSNSTAGGAMTGLGIGPKNVRHVIGIAKAYTTRVGNGPFPTELDNEIGQRIRERGHEYGASTGRTRRCGWEDLVALRKAAEVNGVTHIALMKMDVLDEEHEIKVCWNYFIEGFRVTGFPSSIKALEQVKPEYAAFKGWRSLTDKVKSYGNLPLEARKYIHYIQHDLKTDIAFLSVGPERDQTIRP